MKRSLFCLSVCALALTACTSEEPVNEGALSNAIGFDHVISKQARAGESGTSADGSVTGDLTKENLDQFLVYGYYTTANLENRRVQVFGGDAVTLNKSNGKWEYSSTRYWVPGASYNFYAYSCADIALNNTWGSAEMYLNASLPEDRALKITNYICDRRHQHDLIYASATATANPEPEEGQTPVPNQAVAFRFNHVLSKVDVIFSTDFAPDYTVEVTDVMLTNFRNFGNYNGTKWTDVVRAPESESVPIFNYLGFPGNNIVQSASGTTPEKKVKTGAMYVIPYHYTQADVQLKFKMAVKKDGVTIVSREMTGSWRPFWEVGKYYTYNILLTGSTFLEPIVFETSSDMNLDWTNGSDNTATDMTFSAN